nr:tRNA (adenosine(37)-N6)-threonylcarbamoyltransferase complex ATPase subunit type 1 TsaE [Pararhizobium haloflavum]
MQRETRVIEIPDEAAMRRLAEDVAIIVRPGDVFALSGELGAGKSTFARALIRAVANDDALEVPSPTFTLAQLYDARVPIAHFDLYRLADPGELVELGFDEAIEASAVLIEWPERAGDALPADAIRWRIADANGPNARIVAIDAPAHFMARLARSLEIRAFLSRVGRESARRRYLLGDASTRAYERLSMGEGWATILMNAPAMPDGPPIRDGKPYSRIAHLAEDVVPFVAIGRWLRHEGFAAPEILEADLAKGILIVEDLGADGILSPEGMPVRDRYAAAVGVLVDLHRRSVPDLLAVKSGVDYRLPRYDRDAMMIEAELLVDWYVPYRLGRAVSEGDRADYIALWGGAIERLASAEKNIVLRDYHSPNIIWRAERQGNDRIGIIDFQDAMLGPSAYDVASLLQDARVTVPRQMRQELLADYVEARRDDDNFEPDSFHTAYSIMAAQRASKILGIFVRLKQRDGKPGYLRHLPRIEAYLAEALAHDALTDLRAWYQRSGLVEA